MENKYLEKVATMLSLAPTPRSERAVKKPKKIRPPRLKKFHVNFTVPKSK